MQPRFPNPPLFRGRYYGWTLVWSLGIATIVPYGRQFIVAGLWLLAGATVWITPRSAKVPVPEVGY